MSQAFRVRGRRFLITWSQVNPDLQHTDVLQTLETFFGESYPLAKVIIAREPHEDGGTHFHAYVELGRGGFDRNLSESLYLDGKRPQVRPKRTNSEKKSAEEYCRKGTDWIEDGYDEEEEDSGESPVNICDILEASLSYTDYLQKCYAAGVPFGYAKAIRDASLSVGTIITGDDEGLYAQGNINNLHLRALRFDDEDHRSLLLVGPSGIGKTTWAIKNAPKPALWVRHLDKLRFCGPDIRSIIFDDMDYKHRPRVDQINLVDTRMPAVVHIRNVTGDIPLGVHRIFTCNPGHEPFSLPDDAIERRVKIVRFE